MTLTKEHLEARLAGLHQQAAQNQHQLDTLLANREAYAGAIQAVQMLMADLEKPEPSKVLRPKLVPPPPASTTELAPALEGEAT